MSYQINPNTVHRWIREERQRALTGQPQHSAPAFVAIELQAPGVGEANSRALSPLEPQASTLTGIRIEIKRSTGSVTVSWQRMGEAGIITLV